MTKGFTEGENISPRGTIKISRKIQGIFFFNSRYCISASVPYCSFEDSQCINLVLDVGTYTFWKVRYGRKFKVCRKFRVKMCVCV